MPRLKSLPGRAQRLPRRVQAVPDGSWRAGKGSTARGYDYRWQKARERYLQAHPLCVMCQEQGRVAAATVVDHKTPHQGDQRLFWDETNWQGLCTPCHSGEKQRQERGHA
jgi:5-methylcytosine-specific restriction protein A